MKKWYIILGFIIVIIIAICVGVFTFKPNNAEKENNTYKNTVKKTIVNEVDYSIKNDITINVNTNEDKISPNATLVLKRTYKECGHTIRKYKEIPEDMINLTKEKLQEKYVEWEIEKFTPLDVILIKEEEGICGEHYTLKEKDGLIAIYKQENDGTENLEEITGIGIEYLEESDKTKIKQGIKVYGKEELNSILEDYE